MVNDQLHRIHHRYKAALFIEKMGSKIDQLGSASVPHIQEQPILYQCDDTIDNLAKIEQGVIEKSSPTLSQKRHSPEVVRSVTQPLLPLTDSSPEKYDESSSAHIHHQQFKSVSSPNINQQQSSTSKSSPNKKPNSGSGAISNKRRSSWRNLLTPSYKSRSDEFHKLFCDKIPKTERLIADYACALHREILIQGRVYISVNYIAFYSNLFSWITKLVVRLRDVSEIYKANTARIIPNAIQIITTHGEKHVFASFVARDRSYVMMLRIWQNNLMNERMTDQEIRNLVYFSYGKDLGMSDNEELKINSPDPVTPANVPLDLTTTTTTTITTTTSSTDPPLQATNVSSNKLSSTDQEQHNQKIEKSLSIDKNNNIPSSQAETKIGNENLTISQEELLSDKLRKSSIQHNIKDQQDVYHHYHHHHQIGSNHSRYNSLDFNARASIISQNVIIEEVASKLTEISNLPKLRQEKEESHTPEKAETFSPATSSTVILETPKFLEGTPRSRNSINDSLERSSEAFIEDLSTKKSNSERDNVPKIEQQTSGTTTSTETETPLDVTTDPTNGGDDNDGNDKDEIVPATRRFDGEELIELTTFCGCDEHKGQLIVDQEFDINIDTLFTLIFTNSKFIRTYHIRRGMTDTTISGWKRSNNGDKSNSSTLSSDARSQEKNVNVSQLVRIKQVRQLNYSMNLDHMWAKQVQVEEKQNICQVKPGVYVLKSQTINSGIPYGETFTVDTSYCLTRNGDINKSRMLVHSYVNFNKDKQNWKLAMVKSMIERQSLQGVKDFIVDLTSCIKEYINETIERSHNDRNKNGGVGGGATVERGDRGGTQEMETDGLISQSTPNTYHHQHGCRKNSLSRPSSQSRIYQHQYKNNGVGHSGSLIRAKSMLKERKLKNMYRYYIRNDEDIEGGNSNVNQRKVDTNNSTNYCDHSDDIVDSEDGSSLVSMGELDDNGSMMMMVHATDASQFSDAPSDDLDENTDCCGNNDYDYDFDSMDRSFSDVDNGRRRRKRRSFDDKRRRSDTMENRGSSSNNNNNKHNWQAQTMLQQQPHHHHHQLSSFLGTKRSASVSTTTTGTKRGNLNGQQHVVGGSLNGHKNNTRRSSWSKSYPLSIRGFQFGSISMKSIVCLMITVLLMMLCAMIVSHVVILKKLDKLAMRLQVECNEQLLNTPPVENRSSNSNSIESTTSISK